MVKRAVTGVWVICLVGACHDLSRIYAQLDDAGPSLDGGVVGVSWSPATEVERVNTMPNSALSLSMAANGEAVVAWVQVDTEGPNVWSARGEGWRWVNPLSYGGTSDGEISMATNADGKALAAWNEGPMYTLHANNYGDDIANSWGLGGPVDALRGDVRQPQLALDPKGNGMMVCVLTDGLSKSSVWASEYVPGAHWVNPKQIDANQGFATLPQVAMDAKGNVLAAWWTGSGSHPELWTNRMGSQGEWGVASQLAATEGVGAFLSLAVDEMGNFLVVWVELDPTGPNLWSRRYAPGSGWDKPLRIRKWTKGAYLALKLTVLLQSAPSIAMDRTGAATAVWSEPEGMASIVWASRCLPGQEWGPPKQISDKDSVALFPQIAVKGDGPPVIVWSQLAPRQDPIPILPTDGKGREFAMPINGSILARTYDWQQEEWQPPYHITRDHLGGFGRPRVAVDSRGSATAVWEENDGTNRHIWASRMDVAAAP